MDEQINQNKNQQETKKLSKNQVYYQKHADIIKAKNICNDCKGHFTKYNKTKHHNSIKHKKAIENKIEAVLN